MNLDNVKGTRDIAGEDAVLRRRVIETLQRVYEKYGFQPFFTPVLENAEVLKTKISDEMLGLIYEFEDKAERKIGLRYDLTIGLARFAASNQTPMPFKRYQIDRAWRYESPQAGRYREFWQADIDILGVESAKADAECLACVSEALESIGIKNFKIRVNSRKLLDEVAKSAGLQEREKGKAFQIIDKMDKIGKREVEKQLQAALGKEKAGKFLASLTGKSEKSGKTKRSTDDLDDLRKYASMYGISGKIEQDAMLVRGLAYYTGLIFEIVFDGKGKEGKRQSIAGGGRYDDIIEKLSGKKIAATGISIGLDRVCEILKGKGREGKERGEGESRAEGEGSYGASKSITKYYLIPISEEQRGYAIDVLQDLRKKGFNADIALLDRGPGKSLEYASKLGIPFTILIGKEEQKQKKVKVKDMRTGEENLVSVKDLK